MQRTPIETLQDNINRCWQRTGIDRPILVSSEPANDGQPHVVSARNGGFYIIFAERGRESCQGEPYSLLEATRWYVFDRAEEYSISKELLEREAPDPATMQTNGLEDDGYSRWNWMAPTIQIMKSISPEFGDYAYTEFLEILKNAPLESHELRNARWPLPLEQCGH
jgi:hypothetical protein